MKKMPPQNIKLILIQCGELEHSKFHTPEAQREKRSTHITANLFNNASVQQRKKKKKRNKEIHPDRYLI